MTLQTGSQLPNTISVHSLDSDRLNELYGDDTEYAACMFETFLEEVLPEFNDFEGLIQQQRWEETRQLAHKLRPTLSMVGLSDLEASLAQFETLLATEVDSQQIYHLWSLFHSNLISRKSLVWAEWQRLLTHQKP